jgi:four helix bundle protein
MQNQKHLLSDRLLDFAANVIQICDKLADSHSRRHIANQLMRSATSAGANYEEACGAESRSDFIHKMQVALKETQEALYWLKLVKKASLIPGSVQDYDKILNEAQEINRMIAKSVITAKKSQ